MIRLPHAPRGLRWFPYFTSGLLLFTGGCSSFNRAWKTAETERVESHSLAGRWEGTWRSTHNGHHDTLRGLFTLPTNAVCEARFHARYSKWGMSLSFSYSVPLQLDGTNGSYRFQGQADLGWYAGGVYRYEGTVSGTNFFSTYESQYDKGEFHLQRAAPRP
jgi:hypothetical protein